MALYIDNSTLKAVARCDMEAIMRYGLDYTSVEEQAVLKSGTAGHECLAVYFRTGDKDAALAMLDLLYKDWADANVLEAGHRLTHVNVRRICELWMEKHPINALPFRIPSAAFIEVGFQYPLDEHGDIIFTGRMDIVVQDGDGDTAPCDNKFTWKIDARWLRAFRNDSQMTGYMWAASQHTGQPLLKAYVNAIELSKLPSSNRTCKDHAVPYSECQEFHINHKVVLINRAPDQLVSWRRTALQLAKKFIMLQERFGDISLVHKINQQGMFHGACTYCTFHSFCASNRPAHMVDQLYTKEKWNPLAYATGGSNDRNRSNGQPEDRARNPRAQVHPDLSERDHTRSEPPRAGRGRPSVGVRGRRMASDANHKDRRAAADRAAAGSDARDGESD